MSNIVKQGQSFLDKVTQLTGSYENALEMAFLNDMSITDDSSKDLKQMFKTVFGIGTVVNSSNITNKRVVAFFNPKNEPATAIKRSINSIEPTGIGFMAIGDNFIIG